MSVRCRRQKGNCRKQIVFVSQLKGAKTRSFCFYFCFLITVLLGTGGNRISRSSTNLSQALVWLVTIYQGRYGLASMRTVDPGLGHLRDPTSNRNVQGFCNGPKSTHYLQWLRHAASLRFLIDASAPQHKKQTTVRERKPSDLSVANTKHPLTSDR